MDTYNDNNTNSNNPDNREQQPRELTEVQQLQIEVDELNTKLRDEKALKLHWKNKVIIYLERMEKISMLDKAILVCGRCSCKLLDLNGISSQAEDHHREIV